LERKSRWAEIGGWRGVVDQQAGAVDGAGGYIDHRPVGNPKRKV
jgi:hypothetical protein